MLGLMTRQVEVVEELMLVLQLIFQDHSLQVLEHQQQLIPSHMDNDKVVEYTVYIKNGSDFQSQKLLAMRDGTTIHSTQFAVMFSSSLLVQCDATISSGNILLRATPETGVSGSTTYKIKREVM